MLSTCADDCDIKLDEKRYTKLCLTKNEIDFDETK